MIGSKLKDLRKKHQITQLELAKILNVSNGTIGNWEIDSREPDYTMLLKIATHFNVSIDYLLGRTDIRNNGGYTVPDNMNDVQIAFANGLEGLTQDDLDDVSEYIKFIKARKNKN